MHKAEFMKRLLIAFLFISILSSINVYAVNDIKGNKIPCNKHPRIKGSCYWVHGRLSNYNGGITLRLWKIGTKRMLGIGDPEGNDNCRFLPDEVYKSMTSFYTDIYGDFLFCPITAEEPGVMQFGCIQATKNLVVKNDRKPAN